MTRGTPPARDATTRAEREALAVANDPILEQMLREERVESKAVDTALLMRVLRYVRPHRKIMAASVSLSVVDAILMTLPPFIIGVAIDRAQQSDTRTSSGVVALLDNAAAPFMASSDDPMRTLFLFFGVAIALIWCLRWFVCAGGQYLMHVLGQRVVHDLRRDVFTHITSMDMTYLHNNPVGRLVNRTTFDVQSLSELFTDALPEGIRDMLFVIILMVVMLSLDAPLALILIAAFPLLGIVGLIYRHLARPAMRTMTAVQSRMNAWLAENLAGMRENHLYRLGPRRRAEFEGLTTAHQRSVTHVIRAWALLRPGLMLTSAIATTIVLWVGYHRVTAGIVSVGVLLTFLQYTTRLWQPVRNLAEKLNLIQTSLTAAERINDVLDRHSKMTDGPDADPSLMVTRGEIAFRNVHFTYPSTDEQVLRGVSFAAKSGETIALVGDTGAGKSTIAHLLSRFYDPTEGAVLIDGVETNRYTLHGLRRGIAIVPQDIVLFAGTIRENITLGAEVDDARIWDALAAVRADDVVRHLGGLGHVLEESGRTLSAGQRQLLSFARALVANPPILLLDEATANVDSETESHIQAALATLTRGRTSVVIAHRLSTIRDASCILVLRNGQIVEQGTHDVLIKQQGEYARLVDLHLRKVAGHEHAAE